MSIATAADADAAIVAAREAFDRGPWRGLHGEDRAKVLWRLADLIDEHATEFALRECMDVGVPYHDMLGMVLPHCAGLFRFFAGQAIAAGGGHRDSYDPGVRILTRREPIGVVGMITPWNFPLALTCSKLAPALAAGNTVIHKPATESPLSALLLAELVMEAGVPEGAFNLLTGPGGVIGDALVRDERVNKIAFTGSTEVGTSLAEAGAQTMKRMTMELGGKSANIVLADADLEQALQAAFWGAFWSKGEVCVAGSRLVVERAVYKEVVERLAALARDAVVGDPLRSETQIGPIVNDAELRKILRYVEIGREEGARLVAGGAARSIEGSGLFLEPTVFVDATNQMRISREEIFGPVLSVIPVEDEAEAVRVANDSSFGLAAGVQTGDLGRGLKVADQLNAGTVWVNTWHQYHPNAPFGGFGMSGYGREQGREALESYTQVKSIWAALS